MIGEQTHQPDGYDDEAPEDREAEMEDAESVVHGGNYGTAKSSWLVFRPENLRPGIWQPLGLGVYQPHSLQESAHA